LKLYHRKHLIVLVFRVNISFATKIKLFLKLQTSRLLGQHMTVQFITVDFFIFTLNFRLCSYFFLLLRLAMFLVCS